MKKGLIGLILLSSLFGGVFFGVHVLAARGTGTQCSQSGTPNDTGFFPYGFICGSDPYGGPDLLSGSTGAGDLTSGDTINVRGSYSEAENGPRYSTTDDPSNFQFSNTSAMVWTVIDGAQLLTSEATISGVSPGGNPDLRCPGTSGIPGKPGPVYGYRDYKGDYKNWQDFGTNGRNASPLAYNAFSGQGKVNCSDYGKMVYWQPTTAGNKKFNFDLKLPGNRTGLICVTQYVSVAFGIDKSIFPAHTSSSDPGALETHGDQPVTASHIAKHSQRCYNVKPKPSQQPCNSNINGYNVCFDVDCSTVHGWIINNSNPGQKVNYSIQWWNPGTGKYENLKLNNGTEVGTAMYGGGNDFSENLSNTFPGGGDSLFGNGTDRAFRLGIWAAAPFFVPANPEGYITGGSLNCHDDVPTVSGSLTCTTATINRVNDTDPDGSGQMQVRIWVNNRKSTGGNGGNVKTIDYTLPQGGSAAINIEKFEPPSNYGLQYDIWVRNVKTDSTWGDWVAGPGGEVGTCYSATCTLQIVGNPLGDNRVKASNQFDVKATVTNRGDGDNAPLYDSVGGNQLTISDGGGDFNFSPHDFFLSDKSIGLGSSAVSDHNLKLTASSSIGTYTVDAYVDYNGRFPVQNGNGDSAADRNVIHCKKTIRVYRPYLYSPNINSVTAIPDVENPESIEYKPSVNQKMSGTKDGSPYYTGNLVTDVSTRLYYKNADLGGSEDPPDFDTKNYASTTLNGDKLFPSKWVDTIFGKDFNHGGQTDTWKLGDLYCATATVDNSSGWIGPDGQSESPLPEQAAATTTPSCPQVEDRPFVRVYGGDVATGGSFTGGSSSGGDIKTYMRGSVAPAGSGAEFAALAIGEVRGFATASNRMTAPAAPNGLTFSNKDVVLTAADILNLNSDDNAKLGGDFGASRPSSDWFNETRKPDSEIDHSTVSGPVSPSGFADSKQTYIKPSGKLILSGQTNYSGHRTLYVEGDVVITGDITYTGGARSNVSDIPSFVLMVKGNIYISKNVHRLDGLYVAQPKDVGSGTNNDANTGRIYTCTQPDGSKYTLANLDANCRSTLKVNGSFIAQEVKLLRTANTLRDVTATSPYIPPVIGQPYKPAVEAKPARPAPKFYWSYTGPMSGKHCTRIYETAGPDYYSASGWPDNYLCSDQDYGTIYQYSWTIPAPDGSQTGGPTTRGGTGTRCTHWDNANEPADHYWGDNYTCVSAANSDFNIQFSNSPIAGKECITIREPSDPTWGTAYFCYRKDTIPAVEASAGQPEIISAPGIPAQYTHEKFNNDHAAESFRLTPEFFLGIPEFRSDASRYDKILTLPPVL